MLITTRRTAALLGCLLLLPGCGGEAPAATVAHDPGKVTERAVSGDAELAWTARMPEEYQSVEQVADLGDGMFVHFDAEHVDQDDPRTVAVYDDDGDVRWSITERDLFDAHLSESGDQVFLGRGDGLHAVSLADGEEEWALDGGGAVFAQQGDVLVLRKHDEADIWGFTQLVDASTGAQIAEVSGDPVAVGDDVVTVSDKDLVRQVSLEGEERWTSAETAGEPSGSEVVTAAAGDGFVLVDDTRHEKDKIQRAYDAATGKQLWEVQGLWMILGPGPRGTVLALDTNYDRRSRKDDPDELVLFDASGETRRAAVDGDPGLLEGAGYLEVQGGSPVLVASRDGRLFDAALEEVGLDEPVRDLTVAGPYLMAGESATTFTLASWQGEEQLTVQLDEPAVGLWALDEAVLVQTEGDEIQLYR